MPVPSSGELKLRADIALEVDGSATGDNVSLGTLSNTVGFTEPDAMSEFYGYVSYIQPTMSGTPTTSSVYDTQMTVTSPSFSNPSGGSVERGFYFGTSSTMTSNTFYSVGNTSATSGTFNKNFTGLSGSTTYRVWAVIRDTQSPARFTETVSSMKSQTTLAAVNYTIYNGTGITAYYDGWGVSNSSINSYWSTRYNHVYYGYSTLRTISTNFSGGSTAQTPNYATRSAYQQNAGTNNRCYLYIQNANAEVNCQWNSIRNGGTGGPYASSSTCVNQLVSGVFSGNDFTTSSNSGSTACYSNFTFYTYNSQASVGSYNAYVQQTY